MLLGIDLMIRNERYLLIFMPCVSLFAAAASLRMLTSATLVQTGESPPGKQSTQMGRHADHFSWFFWSVQCSSSSGGHRWKTLDLSLDRLASATRRSSQTGPASSQSTISSIASRRMQPVFSIKPADMYYADRRMISYLDPRLLPFYGERDVVAACQKLRDLGVRYIHVPDYSLPPVYNSSFQEIMGRRDLSRLAIRSAATRSTTCARPMTSSPREPWI